MNDLLGGRREEDDEVAAECSTLGRVNRCGFCGTRGSGMKLCARCKLISYCGKDCQRGHYSSHKKECLSRSRP